MRRFNLHERHNVLKEVRLKSERKIADDQIQNSCFEKQITSKEKLNISTLEIKGERE
jgi:hypothetical protein